jgi:hypothetical protein
LSPELVRNRTLSLLFLTPKQAVAHLEVKFHRNREIPREKGDYLTSLLLICPWGKPNRKITVLFAKEIWNSCAFWRPNQTEVGDPWLLERVQA